MGTGKLRVQEGLVKHFSSNMDANQPLDYELCLQKEVTSRAYLRKSLVDHPLVLMWRSLSWFPRLKATIGLQDAPLAGHTSMPHPENLGFLRGLDRLIAPPGKMLRWGP